MNNLDQSIERARSFLESEFKGSKAGLAVAAGLHANSLRDIEKLNWNPTIGTLRQIDAIIPDGWQPSGKSTSEAGAATLANESSQAA